MNSIRASRWGTNKTGACPRLARSARKGGGGQTEHRTGGEVTEPKTKCLDGCNLPCGSGD